MRPGAAENSYGRFVNSSNPEESTYYTKFYFFNITNLHEVRENGAKPILKELGPYTYRTVDQKYDISFHWNGSLTYKEKTVYYREPDLTVGDFDDMVVTLNLALVGVLDRVLGQINSRLLEGLLSRIASRIDRSKDGKNRGLFLARTVEELLWGYDEPILHTISRFTSLDTEFALMQNGTDESDKAHVSMINTGLLDVEKIGQFEMWNGLREIDNWNNHSEPVHGTSGTFFEPFLTGDEELYIWVSEMYRAMNLYKASEIDLHEIHMFRYRIDPRFWESDPKYFGQYHGLINVTSNSAGGTQGPPVFFSPPHFCGSDPALRENVIGMDCNSDKRDFYIDVEPYTGISLRAAVRFMISSEYSSKFTAIDPNLVQTVLPVFWLEMYREATARETEPIRSDLYWALDLRDNIVLMTLLLIVVFGLISVAYSLRIVIQSVRRRRRASLLRFNRNNQMQQPFIV